MRRLTVALGVTALLAGGCFPGTDPGTEATERGRPQVEVEFPSTAPAESVQEAVVTVSNPGPGDIDPVVVSFSWVAGTPGEGLPRPIVDGGQEVVSVDPEPSSISADGVVFVFDELEEGGVVEIVFGIRVPLQMGPAANAVVVYDGRETGRARGVRLQTEVTR
jgi:hypothetical protein